MVIELTVTRDGETLFVSTDDEGGLVTVPTKRDDRTTVMLALAGALALFAETDITEQEVERLAEEAVDADPIIRRAGLHIVHSEEPDGAA